MRIQPATAESWKPVLQLAFAFAAIKFAIEFFGNLLAQHFGYGIFRDEMYYIVCGRHLAWGYVDQPPMIAWISSPGPVPRPLGIGRRGQSFSDGHFGLAFGW